MSSLKTKFVVALAALAPIFVTPAFAEPAGGPEGVGTLSASYNDTGNLRVYTPIREKYQGLCLAAANRAIMVPDSQEHNKIFEFDGEDKLDFFGDENADIHPVQIVAHCGDTIRVCNVEQGDGETVKKECRDYTGFMSFSQ